MKFKVLTAYSPMEVQDEINTFKSFLGDFKIIDINVTGGKDGWVIVISYKP